MARASWAGGLRRPFGGGNGSGGGAVAATPRLGRNPITQALAPLALVLLATAPTPAWSQDLAPKPPAGNAISSDARRVLDEIAAAYRSLGAYGDEGRITIRYLIDGTEKTQAIPCAISYQRPNRLALNHPDLSLVADGSVVTTTITALKQYSQAPCPKVLTVSGLGATSPPVESLLFQGAGSVMSRWLLSLLMDPDPIPSLLSEARSATLEPDRAEGTGKTRCLRLQRLTGPGIRLLVDPETSLLRGMELVIEAAADSRGVDLKSITWAVGSLKTAAPEPTAFRFTPPTGFAKLAEVAGDPANQPEPPARQHPLLGKPAPDFSLTVLQPEGKTRNIAQKDLRGKVVLIDFWATWCGPCLEELPEIQRLIEFYGDQKKQVVFLAISQDEPPDQGKSLRELVESTLKARSLAVERDSVAYVGLDPDKSIGARFEVEALPTVVLIDEEGVIRHYGVGFRPNVGKELGDRIDALLKGKPVDAKAVDAAVPRKP